MPAPPYPTGNNTSHQKEGGGGMQQEMSNNNPLSLGSQHAATKSNAIEIPQISLPKGGGALKGIDEKFQVNAANGTASFSIPIPLSPGRNGFQPSLALSYNSGTGNSLFGVGWDLGYSSIQRKTDKKLPRYRNFEDDDIFMFSGVEDLVPSLKFVDNQWIEDNPTKTGAYKVRRYRPRIEGGFSRIERIANTTTGEMWWKVTTRDNTVTYFGKSPTHRIADPADASRIFKWLPELSFDDKGNCMVFEFKEEDLAGVEIDVHEINRHKKIALFTNKHLKKVKYSHIKPFYPNYKKADEETDWKEIYETTGPTDNFFFQAILDYGEHTDGTPKEDVKWPARPDSFSDYRAGFEVRTYRQCQRILIFHCFTEDEFWQNKNDYLVDYLVRSMSFTYKHETDDPGKLLELSYLANITQTGHVLMKDKLTKYEKSLPPLTFQYQELEWNIDIKELTRENLANAPAGLSSGYQFTDFYGEGIPGILTEQADSWFYKENKGGGEFSIAKPVLSKPSFTGLGNGVLQLHDLGADGSKQIVVNSPGTQGYFELDDDNEWEPFRTFTRIANVDLRDPNTKMFDLNGDGQPDIIISEENVFTWFPATGRQGYDSPELAQKPFDEERGPAIVFADSTQSIFIADMCGDGLADIVRIRNGEICYWPNLGYGHFGAKVNMSNAPLFDTPDQFNPNYLQLADISGTGLSDIIYLGKNQFRAWLNLSGNQWSDATEIAPFPQTAHPAQISVTDLLGNGTSCIVWSSPLPAHAMAPMSYIDLMGGIKPHIMKAQYNGMGKVTKVSYKSSTHFYLEDKLAGKPWISKLPFPVQCVEKVEIEDKVAELKFTNTYSYHHGYYDHAEREFRGFGRVEQTDTEDYKPQTAVLDKEFYQAPIHSKTWFHTGAFIRQGLILKQFEKEYYQEGLHHQLEDANIETIWPHSLSAEEYREALRVCKGMTLRQEVYAQDDQPESRHPYSVTEHNCHITLLQARQKNAHAVFLPKESEAITYHYERNPRDPRIAHALNLEFDNQGNVLKSVSVVYARKYIPAELPLRVKTEQAKTHLIFTEAGLTNDIHQDTVFRLRMPHFSKTWELRGFKPASGEFFSLKDFENLLSENALEVTERQYEAPFAENGKQKRLIEHIKTLYRKDDLSGPYQQGEHDTLGLGWESYQLAFTPGLLQDIFAGKLNPADYQDVLEKKCRYEEMDGNWWISSGKVLYGKIKNGKIIEQATLADVKKQFFLPDGYEDPFETCSAVYYYPNYFLMPQKMEDALGNVSEVMEFDFRTLSPRRVKDLNDYESEALSDELGLVTALAIMGKPGSHDIRVCSGDDLLNYEPFNTETKIKAFFEDPYAITDPATGRTRAHDLLGNATIRMVYDFDKKYVQVPPEIKKDGPKAIAEYLEKKPVAVATIAREKHVNHLINNELPKLQISFDYTSALGQPLLKKVQAEPGMAKRQNADGKYEEVLANPRWVGNGRTILNNKGNPVKQYEPYFSVTHGYEDEAAVRELGVTPVIHYDPVGRVISTDMPDGTFTSVEFTPWEQKTFDQNDTVLESDWFVLRGYMRGKSPTELHRPVNSGKAAAWLAAKHADTPSQVFLDTLGRSFFSIADNGAAGKYTTHAELDIEGNQRSVTDARGNKVMSWKYDMLGHQLYQNSMDGGVRWVLNDCMGKPIRKWDSKGQVFETEYDLLHRPLSNKITTNGITSVFEKILYATVADKGANGQIKEHLDTSGLVKNIDFDFKGNLLESQRTLLADPKFFPDWNINPGFSGDIFRTATEYDALNRPLKYTPPYLTTEPASVVFPKYNEAGLLEKVLVKIRAKPIQEYVSSIEYDAKGQRIFIGYGNKTQTRYTYDPFTFRLLRLHTVRPAGVNDSGVLNLGAMLQSLASWLGLSPKDVAVQDLQYSYDPVGNITSIFNNAEDTVFFRNKKVDPHCYYTYDAIYRLIRAEGREHLGQTDQPTLPDQFNRYHINLDHPGDGNALSAFVQTYEYDSVGNILKMHHSNRADAAKSWTRQYQYATGSNQLKGTEITNQDPQDRYTNAPALKDQFTYDVHGNMKGIGGGYNFTWDVLDRLQCINLPNNEKAWYQYDSSGERTRKVISDAQGNTKEERLYLGGFELFRNYRNGTIRESLHIMDDTHRIALVETKTAGVVNFDSPDAINETLIRYQFSNHLGSAAIELDEDARVISYEEYYPYGTTSLQLINKTIKAAAKRYRYTGMERDEESGLNYHSARYYAGWLGRWVSSDAAGLVEGVNLYCYCMCSPSNRKDTLGNQSDSPNMPVSPVTMGPTERYLKLQTSEGYIREHWAPTGTLKLPLIESLKGKLPASDLERLVRSARNNALVSKLRSDVAAIKTTFDNARTFDAKLPGYDNTSEFLQTVQDTKLALRQGGATQAELSNVAAQTADSYQSFIVAEAVGGRHAASGKKLPKHIGPLLRQRVATSGAEATVPVVTFKQQAVASLSKPPASDVVSTPPSQMATLELVAGEAKSESDNVVTEVSKEGVGSKFMHGGMKILKFASIALVVKGALEASKRYSDNDVQKHGSGDVFDTDDSPGMKRAFIFLGAVGAGMLDDFAASTKFSLSWGADVSYMELIGESYANHGMSPTQHQFLDRLR